MLGEVIGNLRKEKGIALKELAAGLCQERMLRKYEKEEIEIEKLLADALMQRLGKSMDKYDIMLSTEEYQQAKLRIRIQALLRRGHLEQAEIAICEYEEGLTEKQKLHNQFVQLQKAELLRKKGATAGEQLKVVRKGIQCTICAEEISTKLLERKWFSVMEIMLLTRYAILQEENGKETEAVEWYQALNAYLEENERDYADKVKLYPLVAYQLAKFYFKQELYVQASYYIEKACTMLTAAQTQIALFGRLLELKMKILQKSQDISVSKEEKVCYCYLEELIKTRRGEWEHNWYPMYVELHIHSVNEMILERRRALGWTREEMADDICDVRTLARMEHAKNMPQKKTREMLLDKLGLSTEKYDGGLVATKYSYYRKLGEMIEAYYQQDYIKANELFLELKKGLDMTYVTNRQFIKYWSIMLRYAKGEMTREERYKEFIELLEITLPLEQKRAFRCQLTEYERRALCTLAWEVRKEDEEKIYDILKAQRKLYCNPIMQYMDEEYYLKILYCLSSIEWRQGNKKRAEHYNRVGLMSIEMVENYEIWDRFLFQKFQIEEELQQLRQAPKPPKSDLSAFQWVKLAYVINKVINQDKVMVDYIEQYVQLFYHISII